MVNLAAILIYIIPCLMCCLITVGRILQHIRFKYNTNKGDGLRFSEKTLILQQEIFKNTIIMQGFLKAIAAMILMTAMCFVSGCTKSDGPNNGENNNGESGDNNLNGHEYVDLGLPSGTLWATCNIGATTPEGYGDYFAWGETTSKDYYNWSTYQYSYDCYKWLTKYCNNSSCGYNGFIDNLTVLQPSDDAAKVNWDAGWSTPTKEQWQELFLNTTHKWTIRNGVNGQLFFASNGQELFLPAAGSRRDDSLDDVESDGNYWSSSLDITSPADGWGFRFNSRGCIMGNDGGRDRGHSVRPVRSVVKNGSLH